MKKNVEPKTWAEFRKTGLFLIVNQILHAFGWCIVLKIEDGEIKGTYPARTKFRGFDNELQEVAHTQIAEYLSKNAPKFPDEIKD